MGNEAVSDTVVGRSNNTRWEENLLVWYGNTLTVAEPAINYPKCVHSLWTNGFIATKYAGFMEIGKKTFVINLPAKILIS